MSSAITLASDSLQTQATQEAQAVATKNRKSSTPKLKSPSKTAARKNGKSPRSAKERDFKDEEGLGMSMMSKSMTTRILPTNQRGTTQVRLMTRCGCI